MLTNETKRRQNELREHIFEMANSCFDDPQIRKMAIQLKGLYANNFRHHYSDFFSLILDIAKDDNTYSLDYLSNNLESLREYVENDYISGGKEFTSLHQPLTKLSDHLNLEIGRYSYYSKNEEKISTLEKRHGVVLSELRDATQELQGAEEKVSTIQTELIAVLSIFAAIVLAFSGSLSFIGNAFSSVSAAPLFKSALFILLCGLVLFNTIFLLLYVVGKITSRSIYARCKSPDCSCGKDGQPECRGLTRVRKRLPYIFWFNVLLVIAMTIDVFLLIRFPSLT